MRGLNLLGAFAFIFSSTYTYAQYFKTLPKGVRLFTYRHVEVAEVGSSFNHSKSETPYSYTFEADAKALAAFPEFQAAFQAAGLPGNASLGTYHLDAKGSVKVDGYGFGYGITNKLTAYTSLPIYNAKVKLNYKKAKGSNLDEVADQMYGDGGSMPGMWANMLE